MEIYLGWLSFFWVFRPFDQVLFVSKTHSLVDLYSLTITIIFIKLNMEYYLECLGVNVYSSSEHYLELNPSLLVHILQNEGN